MILSPLERALARVPDVPGRVDVRGMLLSGKAEVRTEAGSDPAHDGFIALLPARIPRVGHRTPSVYRDRGRDRRALR